MAALTPIEKFNLEQEYRGGLLPLSTLSDKYGIPPTAISAMAALNGWERKPPPVEAAVQRSVDLILGSGPEEQALLTAQMVIISHRKDAARIRTLSRILIDRLANKLSGQMVAEDQDPCGARESAADLLVKLSQVSVRMVEVERQAFGLKHFSPEAEATDKKLEESLEELEAQLAAALQAKAQVTL